jgi:hypothetical protein
MFFLSLFLFFLISVHFLVPEMVVKHEPLAKYESLRTVHVFLRNPQ